jgi:hypothetical protein
METHQATYQAVVNHVFLPPELPQSEDDLDLEALAAITSDALDAYKLLRTDMLPMLNDMSRTLTNTLYVHTDGRVNEERLVVALDVLLRQGRILLLHIAAQNAGIIVSKASHSAIRFEMFELSPLNEAVYSS